MAWRLVFLPPFLWNHINRIMMHLEDSRNIFEHKLHSDANFNSRAVHLFGALASFCGDLSSRSCVCPGDLQIAKQMVDISQESGNNFLPKLRSSFNKTVMLLYSNLRGQATHMLQLCLWTWNMNQALWWDQRFIDGRCQATIGKVVGSKKNLKILLPCSLVI